MYEETKMDLGSLLGLAIILYGLCLMYANVPDFVNNSIILSTEILFKSGILKLLKSSPILSIITFKIFLFSPLTICLIFPLTGETILIFSSFLSKKTGSPFLTKSPSLTSIRGTKAKKSSGFRA